MSGLFFRKVLTRLYHRTSVPVNASKALQKDFISCSIQPVNINSTHIRATEVEFDCWGGGSLPGRMILHLHYVHCPRQINLIVLIILERRGLRLDSLDGILNHLLPDLPVEVVEDVRVVQQELPGIVAALADALAVIGIERPALLDQVHLHGKVKNFTGPGNALAVQHVHDTAPERRSHLVLLDRDLGGLPMISLPSLMASLLRTSMRMVA